MKKEILKVLISGACGQMGNVIRKNVEAAADMSVWGLLDEKAYAEYDGFACVEKLNRMDISPDIIIDFSSPKLTEDVLEYAYQRKISIVIATTGLSQELEAKIVEYSKEISIFKSANMSYQVALFKKAVQLVAKRLEDADIEIEERHHNQKNDSPSGTALMIGDAINEVLDSKRKIVYGRTDKREANEIGIASLRGGGLIGEHSVQFISNNEEIKVTHIAYSREAFADGAMKALRFLSRQENPGLYSMDDML